MYGKKPASNIRVRDERYLVPFFRVDRSSVYNGELVRFLSMLGRMYVGTERIQGIVQRDFRFLLT